MILEEIKNSHAPAWCDFFIRRSGLKGINAVNPEKTQEISLLVLYNNNDIAKSRFLPTQEGGVFLFAGVDVMGSTQLIRKRLKKYHY